MTITYETLFEVLRKEKNQEDLQKLDSSFYHETKKYVADKATVLAEKPRLDHFADGYENEQQAIRIQLNNIRKIIKDIFDRREHKIMIMAVNKAKTGSSIIDTTALLPEEQDFFNDQIKAISGFRSVVLEATLIPGKTAPNRPETSLKEPKELNMEQSEPLINQLKKVHILESVPKFVGIDLEIYGPFDSNEEHELTPEIAEMLIKTNKARFVEQ
jgi:DNA replication initiation complex subunit (GINS family)